MGMISARLDARSVFAHGAVLLACLLCGSADAADEDAGDEPAHAARPRQARVRKLSQKRNTRGHAPMLRRDSRLHNSRRILLQAPVHASCAPRQRCGHPGSDQRLASVFMVPCHARADWQHRLLAALFDRTRA